MHHFSEVMKQPVVTGDNNCLFNNLSLRHDEWELTLIRVSPLQPIQGEIDYGCLPNRHT